MDPITRFHLKVQSCCDCGCFQFHHGYGYNPTEGASVVKDLAVRFFELNSQKLYQEIVCLYHNTKYKKAASTQKIIATFCFFVSATPVVPGWIGHKFVGSIGPIRGGIARVRSFHKAVFVQNFLTNHGGIVVKKHLLHLQNWNFTISYYFREQYRFNSTKVCNSTTVVKITLFRKRKMVSRCLNELINEFWNCK